MLHAEISRLWSRALIAVSTDARSQFDHETTLNPLDNEDFCRNSVFVNQMRVPPVGRMEQKDSLSRSSDKYSLNRQDIETRCETTVSVAGLKSKSQSKTCTLPCMCLSSRVYTLQLTHSL